MLRNKLGVMQNKNLFVNSGKKSQMMVLWLLAGMYTVPNAVEIIV